MTIELPTFPTYRERRATAGAEFREDTAEHVMRILHDDGLYRHVVFSRPGSGIYRFELITAPGILTVTGDMGSYAFERLEDMFQFFRTKAPDSFDPHYWAQKCVAGKTSEYSEEAFRENLVDDVRDHITDNELDDAAATALWEQVQSDVLFDAGWEESAKTAADEFTGPDGFEFHDVWEWNLKQHTIHFLWICHAITEGIRQFDLAKGSAS